MGPGKADTPVDLEGFAGNPARSLTSVLLGDMGCSGRVAPVAGDRPRRVAGGRPTGLDPDPHVGQPVLDGLEAADRASELVSRDGVGYGHLQESFGGSDGFGAL